jgi:hypothetical protein
MIFILFIYYIFFNNSKIKYSNKINVKKAMEYVARAWDLVKAETIINCWRKTGILPTVDDDDDIQQALIAQERASQEDQEGIEFLLQQVSSISDKSLEEVNQYLEIIDLTVSTEQPLTDTEIIRLILDEEHERVELNNDESDEEHLVISIQEGFNSLKTWMQYFEEQESEEFDMQEIRIFRKYMGIMQRKLIESKTQKNITSFFMPTNM